MSREALDEGFADIALGKASYDAPTDDDQPEPAEKSTLSWRQNEKLVPQPSLKQLAVKGANDGFGLRRCCNKGR